MPGAGKLGGVTPAASSTVLQSFAAMPKGAIAKLLLTISFTVKSTGSAFAAVVTNAATEGTDDLDIILNGLITSLSLRWDAVNECFTSFTPAQIRTLLGVFMQRDIEGTFINGLSIPASGGSALAVRIGMAIPVSLDAYFRDGRIFQNGSRRLSRGRLEWNFGANVTNPSFVLANGTAQVQSGSLAINVNVEKGTGSESDVGCSWRVKKVTSAPSPYSDAGAFLKLAVLDTDPSGTNAATAYNMGEYRNIGPTDFQTLFQAERDQQGGFDVSQRVTPLDFIRFDTTVQELPVEASKDASIELLGGKTSLNLYIVEGLYPPADIVADVAQAIGGGGGITTAHPAIPSAPPNTAIPVAAAGFMPVRVYPGKVAFGTFHPSPEVAAMEHTKRIAGTQAVKSNLKAARGA